MKATSFIRKKILSRQEIQTELKRWRLFDKKIVFTNGCFDILHAGHIHSLTQAASFGDILVIGLNSDASTRRLKGDSRPIQNENDRALLLASLVMVDAVVVFEEDTPLQLIQELQPDVLVKGGDYTIDTIVGSNEVIARGGSVEIISLLPGHSTTLLAQAITRL